MYECPERERRKTEIKKWIGQCINVYEKWNVMCFNCVSDVDYTLWWFDEMMCKIKKKKMKIQNSECLFGVKKMWHRPRWFDRNMKYPNYVGY